jgi:anti-sigma-K factor RskA
MSMHDDHNTIEPMDELELYVLDLLDDDEREALEAEIAADPAMQERLRELRGTTGMLAFDLEPMAPPSGLRDRILDQARAEATSEPAQLHPVSQPDEPISIERTAPWLWIAAAILAVAMVGAIAYAAAGDQTGDLRTYPVAVTDATDAPISGEVILREGSQQATLLLSGLQSPPSGQVYQVWLVAGDDPPVPNITFSPGDDGNVSLLIRGDLPASQLLAITLEPAGGSPAPTTDILLVSDLTQPDSV